MEEKKNNLWKGLSGLDTIEETCPLSDEEKLDKDWLKSELKRPIFWRKFVGGRNQELFVL